MRSAPRLCRVNRPRLSSRIVLPREQGVHRGALSFLPLSECTLLGECTPLLGCIPRLAMARFVVLYHELPPDAGRPSHWDLMVEAAGSLRTWAVDEFPQPGKPLAARALVPHRLTYLTYEGPLSGGRGSVVRVDAGECTSIDESAGHVSLELSGQQIRGRVQLVVRPTG